MIDDDMDLKVIKTPHHHASFPDGPANAIFEYLEIFHNRQHRRHSALGMVTPVEFETRHQPTTAA